MSLFESSLFANIRVNHPECSAVCALMFLQLLVENQTYIFINSIFQGPTFYAMQQ